MNKKKPRRKIILIKKSNEFIESRYKLDIWETRVFLSILGKINKDDIDFKPYRLSYKEIIETWGLPKTHSYKYLREAAKKLMDQTVTIAYDENGQKREKIYHLLRYVDVSSEDKPIESQEYILVDIESSMKPYLIQLQKNFTSYDLRYITKLGAYSIRLYELLKQYQKIGSRKMNIEFLKEMFELTDLYPLFGNFYQKVIKPSVDEINEYSDLKIITVDKIKEGKKVTDLFFKFYIKPEHELVLFNEKDLQQTRIIFPDENISSHNDEPITEFKEVYSEKKPSAIENILMNDFGITGFAMKQIMETYSILNIQKKIDYIKRIEKKGNVIENKAGYLVNALKNNFLDDFDFKETRKEEKKQMEDELSEKFRIEIEELNTLEAKEINGIIDEMLMKDSILSKKTIEMVSKSKIGEERLQKLGQNGENEQIFLDDLILRNQIYLTIYKENRPYFEEIVRKYKGLKEEKANEYNQMLKKKR